MLHSTFVRSVSYGRKQAADARILLICQASALIDPPLQGRNRTFKRPTRISRWYSENRKDVISHHHLPLRLNGCASANLHHYIQLLGENLNFMLRFKRFQLSHAGDFPSQRNVCCIARLLCLSSIHTFRLQSFIIVCNLIGQAMHYYATRTAIYNMQCIRLTEAQVITCAQS